MQKNNKSFSRRVGRKLRPAQKNLLTEFLPTITFEDDQTSINLQELFNDDITSYELEIGFGSGEHMVARAMDDVQIGCIGCEPYLNGVAKALSLIKIENVQNLKIYSDDVNHIIDRLGDHSLNKIWVLFPDPWPKRKHHSRRIINENFLSKISRILKKNGKLVIATDHAEYAKWILTQLQQHKSFELLPSDNDFRSFPDDWHKSKYQLKAEARGLLPFYFEFKHNYIIN